MAIGGTLVQMIFSLEALTNRLRSTIRSTELGFSFSSLTMSGLTMLANLLMLKWLRPDDIGLWQSVVIVNAYAPFVQLGIQNGLNRELPFLFGKGEPQRAERLVSSAKGYALLVSGLLLLLTACAVCVCTLSKTSTLTLLTVGTVGVMASLSTFQNHLTVTYRSSRSFDRLTRAYLFQSLAILFAVPLVPLLGYPGLLLYYVITTSCLLIFLFYYRPIRTRSNLQIGDLQVLAKVGLPVFVLSYLLNIGNTFPKLILLNRQGVTSLGFFSPALAVSSVLMLAPTVVAQYFYPRMSFIYGQTSQAKDLWPLVRKVNFVFIAVSTPIAASLWFICPVLIRSFFPAYAPSAESMQWMGLNGIFISTYITVNAFYSIKAYKYSLAFVVINMTCLFLFPFAFMAYLPSNPLRSAAQGILAANVVTFLCNLVLLKRALFSVEYNQSRIG